MFRGNMIRWACVVATTVMAVSGCDCPGPNPPVSCTDTTITFETPTADQTVDSPFDVSFTVKNADGSAFNFERATLSVSGGAAVEATSVSGNRATFTGVPGSAGAQSLVASIGAGTCSKSFAPQNITVRAACSAAAVSAVTFPQDMDQSGELNRVELPPGTDLQVRVDAVCASGVQVRIKRGNTEVSPLTTLSNGTAIITLTGIPASDSETVDLFAELVRGSTAVNTPTSNPQASGTIRVSRALPMCSVTTMGSFGPSDDADTSTPGFQMRVSGTMSTALTGTLGINGQMAQPVVPNMNGDVSADFTIATSGDYTATITCFDNSGNTNTATGTFTVDFTPPTVSIISPMVVDGGATMVVTQSPLPIQINTDAEDGSMVEVTVTGMSGGGGSAGAVTNGMAALTASFGVDGTYTINVRVTDGAGNVTTVTFVVTVALDGCGAVFSRPGACPALLTPAQLSGGTYSFQTSSRAACANQAANLFRSDPLPDGGLGPEMAAGTAVVGASGIANFAPITLTSGDYVFRGQVTNIGADAGVSSTTCAVTVDLDGPVITNPVGTMATINAAQDTQPGTPGVQRVLAFSARVPMGGRVDVCTTQAVNPVLGTPRPTSPECGNGWYVLHQGATSPVTGFTFPDGTYDLKVVVVGGGLAVAPASPPISLVVDGVRPCVNGITRDLPQDANDDGRLSIVELAGGLPQLVFGLGCGDTSPSTLSSTTAVVVRDITGGMLGAVRPSTATFSGGLYTVTLTGPFTTEVDLNLFVELTDAVGNRNLLAPMNDSASFAVRVDPVAPTCTITSPSVAVLGIAQVPGANLDVVVSTSADVATNGVNLTFTGQAARQLTPTLSQAQTTYALTGDNTYMIGATCTDQAGNATPATGRTTRVDLVAPTCNITTPSNPAVSSVNDVTTTVAVTGLSDGDVVTMASTLSGITNNALSVSGGNATRSVRYPNGFQNVTASAVDAAGNPCVAPTGGTRQISLTVNSTSCNLDFASGVVTNANGSWINRTSNPGGASPASVTIGAVTTDCGAGRNVYLYQGAPVSAPTGTPQVTSAAGTVTFANTSVSDGQQWTITIDNGAGVLTHRTFTVSFAAPTITSIGLTRSAMVPTVVTVPPNAPLVFGAATGNRRVETATATDFVFGDLDPAADAQFQLTLTGIDGARVGTLNATLDVLEGTNALMPTVTVTAAPFTPTLPRMKLTHSVDEAPTSLVIRVTSPAGNVFVSTHAAEVDVIAPAAPSVTQNLTSARAATVSLNWAAVFDDGANSGSGGLTGGTPTAGYDVRWTTSSVPGNNSMLQEPDFFGSSSNPDGVSTAVTRTLTLPPLNTYFISVRARDEVGNYSAFAAPASVPNLWNVRTITNPSTDGTPSTHNFGQHVVGGASLNGDTVADLVVASPNRGTNAGSVFVYWGGATADTSTCTLPACQELQPYDNAAGVFGTDISVAGNVGDLGGEMKADLVVGAPTFQTNVGRAFLYFGTSSTSINGSNFIEFRGTAGSSFASAARIIRDIDGDGLDEIAFSAHTELSGQGRVYIFKGRSADPAFNAGTVGANWFNSRTAMDGTNLYVPASAANWILVGPSPVDTGGNQFARLRWGLVSLGDITGDGRSDFVIPISKDTANGNRVLLYSGSTVASAVAAVPTTSAIQSLVSPTPFANSGTNDGFGRAAVAGSLFGSATLRDLIVSNSRQGRVYVYGDLTSTGFSGGTPTHTVQGSLALWFGYHLSTCDLNADSRADLVVGEVPSTGGRSFLLWQTGAGTFEPTVDRTTPAFWLSELNVTTAGSRMGRMTACVDGTGDGVADVVLGDEGLGRVQIHY